MNKNKKKYFLVGIKGSGMSALACMLYDLGYFVIGSDYKTNYDFNDGLSHRNISVLEFDVNNINKDYIYIIGNAYSNEDVEVKKILEEKYKYYYYQDFIATLPGIHIAVSGTHGKTTTTKMIVDMLETENVSCIVGSGYGKGTKNYKYLVYEACEYKEHFLSYHPDYLIITNIDYDHPDYYHSLEDVCQAFNKLKSQSKIVIEKNMCNYKIVEKNAFGFDVEIDNERYKLPFYGEYMIDNFICCYLLLKKLGYSNNFIKSKIKKITLPTRRMEEHLVGDAVFIYDYAHHPTEIKALAQAVKHKYPDYKVTVFFEPHTYSRTLTYLLSFKEALSLFDDVYIKDVFSSKREKLNQNLQKKVDQEMSCFKKYQKDILKTINIKTKNIYIFMGAGTIYQDANLRIMKMD